MRRTRLPVSAVVVVATLALLTSVGFSPVSAEAGSSETIFINELHYDNVGADSGEFVEVAGPAGADLAGWSVALYNGSNGTVYETISLSGSLPNENGGFGALSFTPNGSIQNGAPDGAALIDSGGAVVQFWSYEGTLSATDGPASGVASTDIGVSESSSTAVGDSLQLIGVGTVAGDFTWSGPVPASPGSLNAGQSFGAGSATVVVNEIMQNPGAVADGSGEYIELYNPGGSDLDIQGWTIADGGSDSHVIGLPVVIPGGGYAVLGVNADQASNGGVPVDYQYSGFNLANGDDEVIISNASGDEIDRVDYDGGPIFPDPNGASMALKDPADDNNDGTSWCTSGSVFGAGDFGTPGAENDCVDDPGGITLISTIQGDVPAPDPDASTSFPADGDPADNSPLTGASVTIEAVVTGWDDLAGQANSGNIFHTDRGFFVQEEDADSDGNPATSEGIFVQFSSATDAVSDYQPGDLVQITGTVAEHFEFTVIAAGASITTVSSGNPAPTAVTVDPATIDRNGWEALEGQRARLPQGVANSGGTNRFGELILTPGSTQNILIRPETNPGVVALVGEAGAGNPSIPRKPTQPSTATVKADLFDSVDNATGPVGYSFDLYKIFIQPDELPTVNQTGITYPYTGIGAAAENQIRVTALNVENFFPVGVSHDGSPVTQQEYENKRDRIVDAVANLLQRPDIVGVEEVNDLSILNDVATELGGYTAVLEEGNDNRGIDVGYLVKDTVTVNSVVQLGATAPDPTSDNCGDIAGTLFDRPPLLIDVTVKGATFAVINNHWSSKAAPDACRDAQAEFVRDEVATLEAAGTPVIVTGDLNAFESETPLAILEDGTTTLDNLWDSVPTDEAYSFQFAGVLQTLDHLLITDGFAAYNPELVFAHFDSAYYNRELDEPTLTGPFNDGHKVSDHDPPVLTLTVEDGPAGATCNGLEPTIIGTDGNDDLVGTAGVDVIQAGAGNDSIDGGGGADVICAGAGNDTVNGGPGADTILGEAGNDTIVGNGGGDTIEGGRGHDTLAGNGGADTINGNRGNDTIEGGRGNDTLIGNGGNDTIDGGNGTDSAAGNAGFDSCTLAETVSGCEN